MSSNNETETPITVLATGASSSAYTPDTVNLAQTLVSTLNGDAVQQSPAATAVTVTTKETVVVEEMPLTEANVDKMLNTGDQTANNRFRNNIKNSFGNMSTESMDGSYCSAAFNEANKNLNATEPDNVPIQSKPRNAG